MTNPAARVEINCRFSVRDAGRRRRRFACGRGDLRTWQFVRLSSSARDSPCTVLLSETFLGKAFHWRRPKDVENSARHTSRTFTERDRLGNEARFDPRPDALSKGHAPAKESHSIHCIQRSFRIGSY
jgi:hypothetical protein